MLQGTRRSPEAECAPLVFGHRPLPIGFFARNFSTGSRGLPLVGKRLRQQSRFVSSDEDAVAAPFTSVVSRYRVTPRVESRGKTSYTGTERPSMLCPFLDTRLTRTKSPRSRQYLVRTVAASLARQLDALATYRTTVSRLVSRDAPTYLTRSARRFSRPAFAGAALTRGQPVLSRLRKSARSRVAPQLLIVEQGERARRVTTQRQIILTNRRTANPRGWSISTNAVRHHGLSVQSTRAALLSRTAAARSTSFTFRAALVLPPHTFLPFLNPANRRSPGPLGSKRRRRPVFASERLQQALSRGAFAIRRTLARMSDAHEKTLRGCDALLRRQQERKARLSHLKGKLATSLKPRERLEISRLTKDVAGAHKRLVAKREEYRHLWLASFIKLLERAVELPKAANVRPLSASNPLTLEQRILTPALPGPHAFVYGGAVHSTMGVVTEACAEETRDRQQTPFDSYRTKL